MSEWYECVKPLTRPPGALDRIHSWNPRAFARTGATFPALLDLAQIQTETAAPPGLLYPKVRRTAKKVARTP